METWILLIFIASNKSTDMLTQEFDDQAACLNAKEVILENKKAKSSEWSGRYMTLECVPKSVDQTIE